MLNNVLDAIIITDTNLNIVQWNKGSEQLYGYSEDSVIGKNIDLVCKTQISPETLSEMQQDVLNHNHWSGELLQQTNTGEYIWVMASVSLLKNSFGKVIGGITINHDITNRKKNELKIKELLEEKEFLLKEVHHRIKNNLQIIISLLHIGNRSLKDPDSIEIILQSIGRIESMNLLYDKLYTTGSYSETSTKYYFHDLLEKIMLVNSISGMIDFEKEIEDFMLEAKTLLPLGIIVNEVITNSIKYAFQDTNNPSISVKVHKNENIIYLAISDNGRGFIQENTCNPKSGFGLQLVKMLTKQLRGKYTFFNQNGTTFHLDFPHVPISQTI